MPLVIIYLTSIKQHQLPSPLILNKCSRPHLDDHGTSTPYTDSEPHLDYHGMSLDHTEHYFPRYLSVGDPANVHLGLVPLEALVAGLCPHALSLLAGRPHHVHVQTVDVRAVHVIPKSDTGVAGCGKCGASDASGAVGTVA